MKKERECNFKASFAYSDFASCITAWNSYPLSLKSETSLSYTIFRKTKTYHDGQKPFNIPLPNLKLGKMQPNFRECELGVRDNGFKASFTHFTCTLRLFGIQFFEYSIVDPQVDVSAPVSLFLKK